VTFNEQTEYNQRKQHFVPSTDRIRKQLKNHPLILLVPEILKTITNANVIVTK